jgi:hypothetical protein
MTKKKKKKERKERFQNPVQGHLFMRLFCEILSTPAYAMTLLKNWIIFYFP